MSDGARANDERTGEMEAKDENRCSYYNNKGAVLKIRQLNWTTAATPIRICRVKTTVLRFYDITSVYVT